MQDVNDFGFWTIVFSICVPFYFRDSIRLSNENFYNSLANNYDSDNIDSYNRSKLEYYTDYSICTECQQFPIFSFILTQIYSQPSPS